MIVKDLSNSFNPYPKNRLNLSNNKVKEVSKKSKNRESRKRNKGNSNRLLYYA